MKALRKDSGAATAETAIVLMVVSALLALLAGIGAMFVSQAQLSEGARTAAREVIRGESEGAAIDAGHSVSGDDAQFSVARSGEYVTVTATRPVTVGGHILSHTFTLNATATARIEPHLVEGP